MSQEIVGAARSSSCERCGMLPVSRDGLCQCCYLIVTQDARYRPTAGEMREERLAHRSTLARYDAMRRPGRKGRGRI